MATECPITPCGANECFSHSPVSWQFAKLTAALTVTTEYERDIEVSSTNAPGFSDLLRADEQAWDDMSDLLTALLNTPPSRPADGPLIEMAETLCALLDCEDRDDYDALQWFFAPDGDHSQCPGNNLTEQRVAEMLRTAHHRIIKLCEMESFLLRFESDDTEVPQPSAVALD